MVLQLFSVCTATLAVTARVLSLEAAFSSAQATASKKLLLAFNLITQFYLIFLSLNVKLSKEIFEEHQRLEFWIQGTLITFCMMQTSLVHSLSLFSAS